MRIEFSNKLLQYAVHGYSIQSNDPGILITGDNENLLSDCLKHERNDSLPNTDAYFSTGPVKDRGSQLLLTENHSVNIRYPEHFNYPDTQNYNIYFTLISLDRKWQHLPHSAVWSDTFPQLLSLVAGAGLKVLPHTHSSMPE